MTCIPSRLNEFYRILRKFLMIGRLSRGRRTLTVLGAGVGLIILSTTTVVRAETIQIEVPKPLTQDMSNVYVDRAAGIPGDGSAASPFLTIGQGINKVDVGGTVWIRRGVYGEPLTISKELTLRSDGADPVLIAGATTEDSDGDALPDLWETVGFDSDGDGRVDVDLPAMGADPQHKDIFVEVDYMVQPTSRPGAADGHSHQPAPVAIQQVVDAFDDAPVTNPDGQDGIHLHVDYGTNAPLTYGNNATWAGLSDSDALTHRAFFGACPLNSSGNPIFNWSDFNSLADTNFPEEREPIFHYSIWGHELCNHAPDVIGKAQCLDENCNSIEGSRLLISLGNTVNVTNQAVDFMHEFGHNLGLRHGGVDNLNHKPNYLSIMNYSFSFWGLTRNGVINQVDYSRWALPTLDEESLTEASGIGLPTADTYQTDYWCRGTTNSVSVNGGNPIDWNCDADTADNDIEVNINNDLDGSGNAIFSALEGHDDWDNLVYDGGGVIGLSAGLGLVTIEPAQETIIDEPAREQTEGPNQLPQAGDDDLSVSTGSSTALDVLANDWDPDQDLLQIIQITQPTQGTATTDGSVIVYSPDAGFTGEVSLEYTVWDGKDGTSTATLTITVAEEMQPEPDGSESLYLPVVVK